MKRQSRNNSNKQPGIVEKAGPSAGKGQKNVQIFWDFSELTECDFKCLFCHRSLRRAGKKKFNWGSSGYELLKFNLGEAKKANPRSKLIITGDEPLNCHDLPGLADYARGIGFEDIALSTTGFKLNDSKKIEALIRAGVKSFRLPIYGHTAFLHDSITGRKGSFKKLTGAIKKIKKYPGIKIELRTLALKQNYAALPRLCQFVIRGLGISTIRIRKVLPRNYELPDYAGNCPLYSKVKNIFEKFGLMPGVKIDLPLCFLPKAYLKNELEQIGLIIASQGEKNNKLPLEKTMPHLLKVSLQGTRRGSLSNKKDPLTMSIWPDKCGRCALSRFCQGIPKAYALLYGDSEIIPIKK